MVHGESVMLTSTCENMNAQANQKRKGKIPSLVDIKKEVKCYFYKKKGHVIKDYTKFKK